MEKGMNEKEKNKVIMIEEGKNDERLWVKKNDGMEKIFFKDVLNWKYYKENMERIKGRKM